MNVSSFVIPRHPLRQSIVVSETAQRPPRIDPHDRVFGRIAHGGRRLALSARRVPVTGPFRTRTARSRPRASNAEHTRLKTQKIKKKLISRKLRTRSAEASEVAVTATHRSGTEAVGAPLSTSPRRYEHCRRLSGLGRPVATKQAVALGRRTVAGASHRSPFHATAARRVGPADRRNSAAPVHFLTCGLQ